MTEDFKNRIADYFDAFDLVDLLGITTMDIVEAFPEIMEDNEDMLEDYVRHGR